MRGPPSLRRCIRGALLCAGAAAALDSAPPAPAAPAPTTIQAPSWFSGGEGLYVPPFYDTFAGIELGGLSPVQKERFLHWVNTEFCACGQTNCRLDTIANCYTNDHSCPWAPVRIRQILDLVQRGARVPSSAAPSTAPSR